MCPMSHNKNCRQPNFIQVKDYRPKIQCHSITHRPRDEYNIVYITFLILGVAILLPWNIFITCQDYFVQYKLNTNTSYNASYTQNFVGIVGAIGQWTNVFVIILNVVFASSNKSTILRIPVSIGVSMVCILYHAIMTVTDTYDWPLVFFSSCCISVAIMFGKFLYLLNLSYKFFNDLFLVASAIMSSCVYSIATKFPISYINAVVVGTNLSGCITTLFSIVSKLVAPDYQVAATYYFTATLLLLFIAMLMYFVMHYMDFFEYKTCGCLDECVYESISDCIEPTSSRMSLLSKTWPFFFCIWINFFSTLLIFPVYQLGIVPDSGFFISPEWYQDVLTFATFNIMVICGNYLPRLTGQVNLTFFFVHFWYL